MSYKSMFALNSIVMLLAGLAFLSVPEKILLQMGTSETYVSTILAVRFLGTAMITIGLLLWFVKDRKSEFACFSKIKLAYCDKSTVH